LFKSHEICTVCSTNKYNAVLVKIAFLNLLFGVLLGYNIWVPVVSQVFGYWLNQVTKNFFIYKTHCVGLVRKVGLLSKSLGLNQLCWLYQVTTILAVPARILGIFFSTKPSPTAWVWLEKLNPSPQSKTNTCDIFFNL
jgi:hypothetical protein